MSCANYFYICIILFNLFVHCLSKLIETTKVKTTHHCFPLSWASSQITKENMLRFRQGLHNAKMSNQYLWQSICLLDKLKSHISWLNCFALVDLNRNVHRETESTPWHYKISFELRGVHSKCHNNKVMNKPSCPFYSYYPKLLSISLWRTLFWTLRIRQWARLALSFLSWS